MVARVAPGWLGGPTWLHELRLPKRFWLHRLGNLLIDFVVWRLLYGGQYKLAQAPYRFFGWLGYMPRWVLDWATVAQHVWSGHYDLGDRYPLVALPSEVRTVAEAWRLPSATVRLECTPWAGLGYLPWEQLCIIYDRSDRWGWSERRVLAQDVIAARDGDLAFLAARAAGFDADIREVRERLAVLAAEDTGPLVVAQGR